MKNLLLLSLKISFVIVFSIGLFFRIWKLGTVPGINGDEGWWGTQALLFLQGKPIPLTTTAGNPISPFFLVPLVFLHRIFQPSFELLRIVPVLSGIASLAVTYVFCSKLFNRSIALISTLLLCILPTAIVHSRFAQDPSQSILASSLGIYLALMSLKASKHKALWWTSAVVVFLCSLWVHPTNIFVAPFIALPGFRLAWEQWNRIQKFRKTMAFGALAFVGMALTLFAFKLNSYMSHHPFLNRDWIAIVFGHLTSPQQMGVFLQYYLRLFSGISVYSYMSGPALRMQVYDVLSALLFLAVLSTPILKLRTHDKEQKWFFAAWALTLLGFYLVAGPEALLPSEERYGLCLVVPGILLIANAGYYWVTRISETRKLALKFLFMLGALALLGSFYINYFFEFEMSGGLAHYAFKTSTREPKDLVVRDILQQRNNRSHTIIIATEWWSFWPIRYLTLKDSEVDVTMNLHILYDPKTIKILQNHQVWFVEFTDGPYEKRTLDFIQKTKTRVEKHFLYDPQSRPIFSVYRAFPLNGT